MSLFNWALIFGLFFRSRERFGDLPLARTMAVPIGIAGTVAAPWIFSQTPEMNHFFGTAPLNLEQLLIVALAAVVAGFVNAIAGGGSLISFPALTAVGLPAVMANVTNTVALLPGYGGAAVAQRRQLRGQGRRLWLLLPAAVLGGLLGATLLLHSSAALFSRLVPWLILLGTALLALQAPLRRWLTSQSERQHRPPGPGERQGRLHQEVGCFLAVFLAAIYGGYFGAGLGVILLAVLALLFEGSLIRLNGLKQVLSLQVNLAAALLFFFSPQVNWSAALMMAGGSMLGGALGGRLASRVSSERLRALVVVLGIVLAAVFFLRR